MKQRIHSTTLAILTAILWAGFLAESFAQAREDEQSKPLVVFLVRHAEKTTAPDDPELTPEGTERAIRLSKLLRDAKIDQVHTSDYRRTRDTAAPIAKVLRTDPKLYDPTDLPSLVKRLREEGGGHLVVGHSNTTTEMVKLLGADPGSDIDDPAEDHRLYIVTIGAKGRAQATLLRYGKAARPSGK